MESITIKENVAACQCPICGGDFQHEKGCVLEGKPHFYTDSSMLLVDWHRTFVLNKLHVSSVDRSRRKR